MAEINITKSFWRSNKYILLTLIGLFILGLALRFYDLTDPPLDAGYRQLQAAIIARGMYYQMLPNADPILQQTAISLWHHEDIFELPIFERIVALTYLVSGGEQLWIARVYTILFWMIGGLALFLIARKLSSPNGALVATAFYLVLPFGVIISRRFQPDAFMVMWILLSAVSLYHWEEKRDTKSAILVGLTCGVAVVVKAFAVFFIAPMAVAMVLISGNIKQSLRKPQIWLMAGIMIIIPAVVYFVLRSGAQNYLAFWSLSFTGLLVQPSFYVRWYELLNSLFGGIIIIISLAGVVIARPKYRAILIALWVGYILFGLFEPWQIHTHDYYSLVLVPIVALSLAPIASIFFNHLANQSRLWKFLFIGLAVLALAIPSWYARLELVTHDSRINWAAWTRLGKLIPKQGNIIALTDDYGTYVEYFGWRTVNLWPNSQDYSLMATIGTTPEVDFTDYFTQQTKGMDYFLIIAFNELENQPLLKTYLYDHYTFTKGDGYVLFDLHSPIITS
jgi:4-amino-4-deoxy-L-arabinose transferase-like glycosyltransferase